jgi:hypothetical protein
MNRTELLKGSLRPIPSETDIPYVTSPPIQFVFEQSTSLSAGIYTWTPTPADFVPVRPILNNALYFFRTITLSADTTDFDFTTNIVITPQFHVFTFANAGAVLYREAVQMTSFYNQFYFPLWWMSKEQEDRLQGAFSGTLTQGPGLIGKNTITLKGVISATEVTDFDYIQNFLSGYPAIDVPDARAGRSE